MSFLFGAIEFMLAGFFVGLGFWWAFYLLCWCAMILLRRVIK